MAIWVGATSVQCVWQQCDRYVQTNLAEGGGTTLNVSSVLQWRWLGGGKCIQLVRPPPLQLVPPLSGPQQASLAS